MSKHSFWALMVIRHVLFGLLSLHNHCFPFIYIGWVGFFCIHWVIQQKCLKKITALYYIFHFSCRFIHSMQRVFNNFRMHTLKWESCTSFTGVVRLVGNAEDFKPYKIHTNELQVVFRCAPKALLSNKSKKLKWQNQVLSQLLGLSLI